MQQSSIWNKYNRGFTLIETVVVIAVIGLILAILIPAIQAARESARRASCASNLRQLGIALNSYATSLGSLPMKTNGRHGFSVHSMILPYMDNLTIYNAINFDVFVSSNINSTTFQVQISAFLCPSDEGVSRTGPWTNYACNVGFGYQVTHQFNGMFTKRPDGPVTFASVTDGTANTAMAAEWVLGPGSKSREDSLGTVYRTRQTMIEPSRYEEFVSVCLAGDKSLVRPAGTRKGGEWMSGDHGTTCYTHDIVLNNKSCTNNALVLEGAWTATSRHGAKAHVLFSDGHTQLVQGTIASPTWRAIGTRAGGETLDVSGL